MSTSRIPAYSDPVIAESGEGFVHRFYAAAKFVGYFVRGIYAEAPLSAFTWSEERSAWILNTGVDK